LPVVPVQPQPVDLHQLGAHDVAFGLGVVAQSVGQDSQQLLGGAAARAHQVHIAELVLVHPVFGGKLARSSSSASAIPACSRRRRRVVDAPADAGMALECGVDLRFGQLGQHSVGVVQQRVDIVERAAGQDPLRPQRRRAHVEQLVEAEHRPRKAGSADSCEEPRSLRAGRNRIPLSCRRAVRAPA
jgi:hypothetical protein